TKGLNVSISSIQEVRLATQFTLGGIRDVNIHPFGAWGGFPLAADLTAVEGQVDVLDWFDVHLLAQHPRLVAQGVGNRLPLVHPQLEIAVSGEQVLGVVPQVSVRDYALLTFGWVVVKWLVEADDAEEVNRGGFLLGQA